MIMRLINDEAEEVGRDDEFQGKVERVQSKVKWYNPEKGYGFLEPLENGDGSDVFMHFSVLDAAGCHRVEEGDTIVCDVGPGRRGKQVLRVLEVKFAPREGGRLTSAFMGGRMLKQEPENLIDILGEIKWFNPLKGFGFIYPDDGGRDVFLHSSVLRMAGLETIEPGVRVKAKIVASDRGREARSIEFLRGYEQQPMEEEY